MATSKLKLDSRASDALHMKTVSRLTLCFLLLPATIAIPRAGLASGQAAQPAIEAGMRIFNGPNAATGTQGNLSNSSGYFFNFRAENRKNIFRLNAAAQFEYATGTAGISSPSASDAYTMYGAAFIPGVLVYPFVAGRLRPFLGGGAVVGWYIMNLSDVFTQSLSFGYEVTAGVDIQTGGGAGRIWRLRSAYSTHSASLGGNTEGVSLTAFLFSLGLAY
jgi:hypothetical protein